jgi:predicted nucleic acid-binding protein
MATYLVDTNVLLRLVDRSATQHGVAARAVEFLLRNGDVLFIGGQNLIEFWAVATRPVESRGLGFDRANALAEVESLRRMFVLLPEPTQIFDEWFKLIQQYVIEGKRAHDARLAALLLANRIDFLLTFNVEDFRTLGVAVIAPDECRF